MRKRRVLQLVLSLSPGGTERLVIEICRRASDRVESVVCCLDEPGAWASELAAMKVPVIALRRKPGFHPSLSVKVARLIKTHGIDVVHCHHYSPYVYGLLASLLTNVQVIFTEHGRLSDSGPSHKRQLVNPVLSMLPGRICAVSDDLRQHMVAERFPARRVQVIHNGVEPGHRPSAIERRAALASLALPPDAFVMGTVGRLDPVKNLAVMLRAHQALLDRHPEARAVIIGDGPERAALETTAAELGSADAVTFTGYRADARHLMAAFDVYVNCSTYEGVSLTVLEAMATGLPVVATSAGGNPEVVVDDETGFLVPPRSRSIADAVSLLASEPRQRRVMGDAGRWRVIRHFSIVRMVDEYAAIYLGDRSHATSAAPTTQPTPADTMSVSDPTRSAV